ncbi:hypothetical protein ACFW2D_07280 [Streptomyces sp. NPDC058914]|uniref:hypothetical protein n=1 Tax=Streptomyces TaxID=1883 RepID=UPI0036A2F75E
MDRAVLGTYAELVGEGGKVADLGCGPVRRRPETIAGLPASTGFDVRKAPARCGAAAHPNGLSRPTRR